jgi:neutral ceramidase
MGPLPSVATVLMMMLLLPYTAVAAAPAAEAQWKAGAARVRITPARPVWLTGFGARTMPSQGTLHDLHAKALALEDSSGRRAVLVTSDLLGFPATVADAICKEAEKRYQLPRDRILLNASHTHGAPALASPAQFIYGPRVSPGQREAVEAYTRELERKLVDLIGAAIRNLQPAALAFGEGQARFGVNRRLVTPDGVKGFTPNPNGPVDHAVPVLRVRSQRGLTLAVVFGYAAHPTTITPAGGKHYYEFSGDYASFAQQLIEAEHPDAVALFVQGCGGDVMVSPRGTVELAREYGKQLSEAVDDTLKGSLRPVDGPLASAFDTVRIEFATPPSRDALQRQAENADVYHRWHARAMLAALERDDALPKDYPYPIQVWRFGDDDLTLVAMAGEVVADYGLRLKKELSSDVVWVAGYSNDLCAYIPSRRVLAEGGYEADRSMIYYMHPGPWAHSVEETIVAKAHELVGRVKDGPTQGEAK